MLQNAKYIEFANDNSVEVLALGDLEKGMSNTKDRRTETYEGKDENGRPVKYLKEFAGTTVEQLVALDSSPAAQYNKTGHIPYIGIVDPYTLQEIKSMPGGAAAQMLMDAVKEAKKKLNADHGESLKRSSLAKFDATTKDIEATLTKSGVAKALEAYHKLEESLAKEPQGLKDQTKPLVEKLMAAAKTALDDAEGKIGAGDVKAASTILAPLVSQLKGTDLEARAKDLLGKCKPADPAK